MIVVVETQGMVGELTGLRNYGFGALKKKKYADQ
jgi:hypothetical protein